MNCPCVDRCQHGGKWELIGSVTWVNTNTLTWELIGTVTWVYTNTPTWELNRYRRPDLIKRLGLILQPSPLLLLLMVLTHDLDYVDSKN